MVEYHLLLTRQDDGFCVTINDHLQILTIWVRGVPGDGDRWLLLPFGMDRGVAGTDHIAVLRLSRGPEGEP